MYQAVYSYIVSLFSEHTEHFRHITIITYNMEFLILPQAHVHILGNAQVSVISNMPHVENYLHISRVLVLDTENNVRIMTSTHSLNISIMTQQKMKLYYPV